MKRAILISTLLLSAAACALWSDENIQPPTVASDLVINVPDDLKHLLMENPHVGFLLLISEDGELLYRLATESNHCLLVEPATRLIDQATFTPAHKDGIAVPSRLEVSVRFRDVDQERWKETGAMPMGNNTMKVADKKMYDNDRERFAYDRSEIDELDQPLQLISGSIVVLEDENGVPCKGSATVEYYIDHTGNALLPTILTSTNDSLTMSVVKTLERLKISPPTRKGNPTYVKVKQTFDFNNE